MGFREIFLSKKFKWLLAGVFGLIVLLLVFQLGVFVGFRKANFTFRWGDNYHKTFGGPRGGFLRDFSGRDFTNSHGTAGSVAKIDNQDLIIKGKDGVEKIVSVTDSTSIQKGRSTIKLSDIKVDDKVVVIGSPKEDGSIEAKIIRVFDVRPPQLPFNFPLLPRL